MRPPRAPSRRAVVACVGLLAGVLGAVTSGSAAGAQTRTITVHWRGNGHGHGMSQYGALGAAVQGRTAAQIVHFYYPGTELTTIGPTVVRVRLSAVTAHTTVFAKTTGLRLSGYGALPETGYGYFRLVPSGSGMRLQGRHNGHWRSLKNGLGKRADFGSKAGWVQVVLADGTSTRYRGRVGAVRVGAAEWTINRVDLDQYVQGSVPREVPTSWRASAVRAQAIAARSYAYASMQAAGSASRYDICDTSMCQSYGGMVHYDAHGHVLWREYPDALEHNAEKVLLYHGGAVFAQYSASNGGATVDGGQPYLVGKPDPFDTAASGDPYLKQTKTVRKATLADGYGLHRFTSIRITKRDGNGPWRGRVMSAVVTGTNAKGKTVHVKTTGVELGSVLGVYTDYLRIDGEQAASSVPSHVTARPGDAGATIAWRPPAHDGNLAITQYRVSFAGHTEYLSASTHAAWVGPLRNQHPATVTVEAVNAAGTSLPATVTVTAQPNARPVVALAAQRLARTLVDPAHPFRFDPAGRGDMPASGMRSVQLTVNVQNPSGTGLLIVRPEGTAGTEPAGTEPAVIAYRAGHNTTSTVSVPLTPTGTIVFTPTEGALRLTLDQQAYTTGSGQRITVVPRQTIAHLAHVPTGAGAVLPLDGLDGITATTIGVVVAVDATGARSTTLRVWPDGEPAPRDQQVTVSSLASNTNVLVLPVGASRALRIAAGRAGAAARVTLLGTLGSAGGALETFPADVLANDLRVGTTPVRTPVAGHGQLPASGVAALLVHVTVTDPASAGSLWVYPRNALKPRVVIFPAGGTTTSVSLVRLGKDGTIGLRSSVPDVHVTLTAVGYVTAAELSSARARR